ncbi:MAG: c-type cytochrome [Pirellulales bacterium]
MYSQDSVGSQQNTTADQKQSTAPSSGQSVAALRVIKLLWKTQPAAAASSLEKMLNTALDRNETGDLKAQLELMSDRFREGVSKQDDPRFAVSTAALVLIGNADSQAQLVESIGQDRFPLASRDLWFRIWLISDTEAAWMFAAKHLAGSAADTKSVGWSGQLAGRLLIADRRRAAGLLLTAWADLPPSVRVAVVEPMTQHADTMRMLVAAVADEKVAKDLLNTNQLLKWMNASDEPLKQSITKVWGRIRAADDAARKEVVRKTLELLRSGKTGDPDRGQATFKRACAVCHRIYGEGIDVGPEITSNGRGSFDQLVSNVLDPSLVIGEAFRAKNVLTGDGRVLAGVITAQDEKRLTLKVQGGKTVELDLDDVEEIADSPKSLMPDGLEQQMTEQELIDLFAFLSLSKPLSSAENAVLPGTPEKLLP